MAEPGVSEQNKPSGGAGRSWRGDKSAMLGGVVTVVIVAAVIVGIAAFGNGGSAPDKAQQDRERSALLASQAQGALSSGDATKAAELAASALALDPNNTAAKTVAQRAQVSKQAVSKPKPSTQPSAATEVEFVEGAWDKGYTGDIGDPTSLLPTAFPAFDVGTAIAPSGGDATVSGTAVSATAPVNQVVWTVHRMRSRDEAMRFVEKTSKELYSKKTAMVTIDGIPTYFGSDGMRSATAVFVRGRYVFEVTASGTSGSSKVMKDTVLAAVQALADAGR
jgi:hypothetical protein